MGDELSSLAELIAASIAGFDGALEEAVLGTSDPEEVARALEAHVADAVGPPSAPVLYRTGVGIVAGFVLADGRQVVVKVHRWQAPPARLRAVQVAQSHLADAGMPAPRPLSGPAPLGTGVATVEELLPGGPGDGRDPEVRATLARELHRFVSLAPAAVAADVGRPLLLRPPGGPLWAEPHSIRFDFAATAVGAEWIDALAAEARARLDVCAAGAGPDVVGHVDWRVENLGFSGARLVAIYDWDSVAAAPEAVIVGANAAQYLTDWGRRPLAGLDALPTIEEMQAFVADYERARGAAFSGAERETLDAANLALVAYGARCQHSDSVLHPDLAGVPDTGWARLLRERGERGLAG